jgi:DNA-binding LytR/AlgR family response regulator
MKVLIVEDEIHARENLKNLLTGLNPDIDIQAEFDAVSSTVKWLANNKVDLIFLDIHLADDLSFSIFEQIEVETPIIFTTAYDQYALKAFQVNSIDYLLKPIDKDDLQRALEKYDKLQGANQLDMSELKKLLSEGSSKTYQKRFIVQRRDKIMSVNAADIAYFEGEDRYVYLFKKDGTKFIVDYKLSDLENLLDPATFFRLNRSFIAHFDAIDSIIAVSNSRVKVNLNPAASRDIIVSTANTREFKAWLNQ